MSQAICKTCGGSPGHHRPSGLDKDGIGDPGHRVTNATLPEPELRELLKTILFAAIAYGHNHPDATQDALEASYIGHLDDMMEYVGDARIEAVTAIMSVTTEGLFDGPDLFIKRAPIEQACIDLVGYEAFKAIQESLPVVDLNKRKES